VASALGAGRDFRLLAGAWIRSSFQHRISFAALTFGQFAITFLDFVEILFLFGKVDTLAGFSVAEVGLLYGTSATALGVADLVVGNVERVGLHIRSGSFDAYLVRPVPVLVQLAADDFSLRRGGKVIQAGAVLVWSLFAVDVPLTPGRAVLLVSMLVSGTAFFSALFVAGGALQFLFRDAAEAMNGFTYGGSYLTQHPLSILPRDALRALTFAVPLAFVNWYPTLRFLGRPDPLGLPSFVQLCSPLVALMVCALAALAWRSGVARYQSTGS